MMADLAREHPAPTADQLREIELIRQIEMLKREYAEACRPFIEELTLIRSQRPLPPLILTNEQVKEMKLRIPDVDLTR